MTISEQRWARTLAIGALLVLASSPLRALAQDATPPDASAGPTEPPTTEPPTTEPQTTEPPATEPPATEPPEQEAEARDRFRRGVALARAGDCRGAIVELEASYRLVPRPNTLFNLAQCEERLHRYDLAIARYREYLRVAPEDADDRITVEETLASLRDLLGTIRIASSTEAEVWVGDRIVGVAPGDVLVPGGRHAIELRAEGMIPERREVAVTPREVVEVTIELRAAEQIIEQHVEQRIEQTTHVTVERPPLHVAVFGTGVGLTAAAAIVGVGAGVNAQLLHDREAARDPRLPRDTHAIADSALVADVAFVASGALLVATVVVAFLTDWGGEPSETGGEHASPTAWIAPTLGGVAAGGTF